MFKVNYVYDRNGLFNGLYKLVVLVAIIEISLTSAFAGAASVDIDASAPGRVVPARFVGFSFEGRSASTNNQFANSSSISLATLLNLFGGGVIRLGGDSSDRPGWVAPNVMAAQLGAFMGHVPGWTLIYGLNLCASNPDEQAKWAARLTAAVPTVQFQFGNEPDLYKSDRCNVRQAVGGRQTVSNYLQNWTVYLFALRSYAPTSEVAGPDIAANDDWILPFLAEEKHNVSLVTRHYYAICPARSDTTAQILLKSSSGYPERRAAADVALAAAEGLKVRMTETNSICAGGLSGVSDVFVSATWAVEYMMQLIAAGFEGVNFHGDSNAQPGVYTPIVLSPVTNRWSLRPLGYAMLLISRVQGMRVLPTAIVKGGASMHVGAYLDREGKTWVIAVNKDLENEASLKLMQQGSWSRELVMTLASANPLTPVPTPASAVTFGGTSVSEDSSWSPKAIELPRGSDITIPPGGAVLVNLR